MRQINDKPSSSNENIVVNPEQQNNFSRRSVLKLLVLGGLIILPLGLALIRKGRKDIFTSKEINLSINKYGCFSGQELSKIMSETRIDPFEIQTINIRDDGDKDHLTFFVRFDKNFSIDDTVDFHAEIYSSNGDIVGKVKRTLRHPDYVPPEWRSMDRRGGANVEGVDILLFSNKRFTDVVSMKIFVNKLGMLKSQ
jgi:hypothetical protein